MKDEYFTARIGALRWWHSIDLGDGVVTPGHVPLAECISKAKIVFDRVHLQGLSVLDIGAWNGYYSFDAKRRGAARVLATDSFAWSHAHYLGRDSFELARSALGLEVEAREIDPADLSPQSVGTFDVVLLLGVFTTATTQSRCWPGPPRWPSSC
jgi:tRNA (mo5U34)-methyltransferase